MVYIFGVILVYSCKLFCEKVLKNRTVEFRRRTVVIFSFLVFFLISACRGTEVGIDTTNYMEKFVKVNQHSFADILTSFYTERLEFGYALLNKIVGQFTLNPYVIIVVNSAIVCTAMAWFVICYTDDDVTPSILFFCGGMFLQSLNVARQMIATVLLFNSWGALTNKQYKKTAVLFLVSIAFHWTSVIYVTAYLFVFLKEKKWLASAVAVFSFVVIANYQFVIDLLLKFMTAFSYLSNDKAKISARGIWALWMVELAIALVFFLYYYTGKKKVLGVALPHGLCDNKDLLCVPLNTVYYIVLTYIGTLFNFFNRLGVYFLPFTIPLFLNFGKVVKENSKVLYRIYLVGLHICFVVYLYVCTRSGQFKYQLF